MHESRSLYDREHDFHMNGICTSYSSYRSWDKSSAGTVLRRCLGQVDTFRNKIGRSLCVFKVGLTSDPILRFSFYKDASYTHMNLLHASENLGLIQMLEAALITFLFEEKGCRNERYGGECPPSTEQRNLFFVYVVGSRADQHKSIG